MFNDLKKSMKRSVGVVDNSDMKSETNNTRTSTDNGEQNSYEDNDKKDN